MTDRRWAWVEIDLSAIRDNVVALRGLIPDSTMFMAVVKADAYGHGAVQVARAALEAGADRLGVATVDEGCALRAAGIDAPIHLLSEPPATMADEIVAQGLTPTATSTSFVDALSAAAVRARRVVDCHLKIDTGMHRIGVAPEDAAHLATLIEATPGVRLEGVFTHFACADTPSHPSVRTQLDRFRGAIDQIRAAGVDTGIVHAANSPATVLLPEAHFDMVRVGIALYGLEPCADAARHVALRPAMSVKARATAVRGVMTGEGVSYGHTWIAEAPACVITLPLGYADGVHRVASGKMDVLVRGRRCRQVGRVCMDQFMVALPDEGPVSVGEECVLIGRQGDQAVSAEEMAELTGTINYEVACALGMRLERLHIG